MGMSIRAARAAFRVEVVLFGPPATLLQKINNCCVIGHWAGFNFINCFCPSLILSTLRQTFAPQLASQFGIGCKPYYEIDSRLLLAAGKSADYTLELSGLRVPFHGAGMYCTSEYLYEDHISTIHESAKLILILICDGEITLPCQDLNPRPLRSHSPVR